MQSGRIKLSRDRRLGWNITVAFDGIREAVEHSTRLNKPIFLVGTDLQEEVTSYRRTLRASPSYGGTMIDPRARHHFDLLKTRYRGDTATLRKVVSFLNNNHIQFDHPITDYSLTSIDPRMIEIIRETAQREYVTSRKQPEGAADEFERVFDDIEGMNFDGPLVINASYGSLSYMQWVALIKWASYDSFIPLVILVDEEDESFGYENHAQREPLTYDEMMRFLSSETLTPRVELDRLFKTWKASRNYLNRTDLSGQISVGHASQFADFIKNMAQEESPADLLSKAIPARLKAPIMFVAKIDSFDVDHELASGLSTAVSRGAARALMHQAQDVIHAGALANAVPGLVPVLLRIINIIARLEADGPPEEATIIELGVEFSSFEGRIFDAKDRIGDVSKGEILTFLGEANRYLSRFESWRSYREEIPSEGPAGLEASNIAAHLLERAKEAGLLSAEAVAKVDKGVASAKSSLDPFHREGIARSSENMNAAVGRTAISALKAASGDLKKEARSQAAKGMVESSKKFIVDNGPAIIKLAQLRAEKWLEMVVNLITDSH